MRALRMSRMLRIALLAMAFGIGTWMFGWLAVPAIGALHAGIRRSASSPHEAGFAAVIAWLALLLALLPLPAFHRLMSQLGNIFPLPGPLLAAGSLLLAFLLAASAARLTLGIVGYANAATDAPPRSPPDHP